MNPPHVGAKRAPLAPLAGAACGSENGPLTGRNPGPGRTAMYAALAGEETGLLTHCLDDFGRVAPGVLLETAQRLFGRKQVNSLLEKDPAHPAAGNELPII
jgi:hypothetical protein